MADFPYSMAIGRMQQFLKDIPTMGIPEKVKTKALKEGGYKSTNDRTIVPMLKFLELIDATGAPTIQWRALRDRDNYPRVMAAVVREAYKDLFEIYRDAQNKVEKDIHNYIGKNTDAPIRMVSAMVSVFKMLYGLCDFEGEAVSPEEVAATHSNTDKTERGTEKLSKEAPSFQVGGVSVQLNLTVGERASTDQIEAIFKYAAKYLQGRDV